VFRNLATGDVSHYPDVFSSMRRLALAIAVAGLLAAPPAAAAKQRLTIRGAGFGHGVGMSQYGAYGYALHGATYDQILRHYYTDTELGTTDPAEIVRVLLQSTATATFSGAVQAGTRTLDPARIYHARRYGATQVELLGPRGGRIGVFSAPLQVAGQGGVLQVGGLGGYRGRLELRPGTFIGIDVVNALPLEDYVAGVVARESPASWPIEALKAQAVAARTYAVTTARAGATFDQYADTRSQVYGGIAAETPSTSAAVAATRGQVVTYDGAPAVTYFFSTSGGRTEDVENTSLGTAAKPWLKSVKDPYDAVSPKHRWGPIPLSLSSVEAKLSGLVQGRLKGIRVRRRGASPRIVAADIVGSEGRTEVSGATLRARLGLLDTWAFFTTIGTTAKRPPVPAEPGTGGTTSPGAVAGPQPRSLLAGTVFPQRVGAEVQIQMLRAGRWRTVTRTVVRRGGRYTAAVAAAGTYRTVFSGDAGPAVRVR
jgi:stage II sporulation protein D